MTGQFDWANFSQAGPSCHMEPGTNMFGEHPLVNTSDMFSLEENVFSPHGCTFARFNQLLDPQMC